MNLARVALTLIDQRGECHFDLPQLGYPLTHDFELPGTHSLSLSAVFAVFQRKQINHLVQAEAERLCLFDESQASHMCLRVKTYSARRAARLIHEAAALVVANGLDIGTGLLCQRPDRELVQPLDSVADYGLKLTLSQES